jgi:hypothetical protein
MVPIIQYVHERRMASRENLRFRKIPSTSKIEKLSGRFARRAFCLRKLTFFLTKGPMAVPR